MMFNKIAIVAGFQGISQDTKDITTLGRGGSDTTAVALAAALDADDRKYLKTLTNGTLTQALLLVHPILMLVINQHVIHT